MAINFNHTGAGNATISCDVNGVLTVDSVSLDARYMSFRTISVSGQSDVVADAYNDTLTLVAGTNVTITTTPGSDSITINSSATGSTLLFFDDDGSTPAVAPSATGTDSIAIGDGAVASAANTLAIGTNTDATQGSAIAIGNGAQATGAGNEIAIGAGTTTASDSGGNAIAIGTNAAATGTGGDTIAIGTAAAASAGSAISIGESSLASATGAIRIGWQGEADAIHSISIGSYANEGIAAGTYSICIGADDDAAESAQATQTGAIAIGSSAGSTGLAARATGLQAIAIGSAQAGSNGASAGGSRSVCIGAAGASASTSDAIAIGASANASSGNNAVAVGGGASAAAGNALAVGYGASASGTDSVAVGEAAIASTGTGNIAIGSDAAASGSTGAIAIGDGVIASGQSGIAIGVSSEADNTNAIAIGTFVNSGATAGLYSIAIGSDDSSAANTQATGPGAIAIGSSGGGTGLGARSSSDTTIAIGNGSGTQDGALANVNNAIAIGSSDGSGPGAISSGSGSIAIGGRSSATAAYSVALGNNSKADRQGEVSFISQDSGTAARTSNTRWTGTTTTATPTEIFLLGISNARLTVPSDTTCGFTIYITARRTDADNESAYYRIDGCVDNNAGTTALVGTTMETIVAEDTTAWSVSVTADNTNDAVIITVTGEAAKTIRWVAQGIITEARG